MKQSVLLFSGGKESVYNLYVDHNTIKKLLIINYGQLAYKKEFASAKYYAKIFGKEIITKDIRGLINVASAIRDGGVGDINVPMRNTLFISIAVNYAKSIGCNNVIIGSMRTDSKKYTNDGFSNYLKDLEKITKDTEGVTLKSPSARVYVTTIYRYLHRHADLSNLWLCQEDKGKRNCGKCQKCTTFIKEFPDNKDAQILKSKLYELH